MKLFFSLIFLVLGSQCLHAQQYSDAIVGKWMSPNQRCKVEIFKYGGQYYGRIIWLYEPNDPETGLPKTDSENPDPTLRGNRLIGLVVLKNFVFEDGFWQNGSVYDSQNGKSFDCDCWLEGNDQLKIKGSWYFISRTDTWTRCD